MSVGAAQAAARRMSGTGHCCTRSKRGVAFDSTSCVREIASVSTPIAQRALAADEEVLRTGIGTEFEADGWVTIQRRALRAWEPPV